MAHGTSTLESSKRRAGLEWMDKTQPILRLAGTLRLSTPAANRTVGRFNLTASQIFSACLVESASAAGASWQGAGERDDQHVMHGGDRVGDVALRPDRRRRGVGNRREGQVS